MKLYPDIKSILVPVAISGEYAIPLQQALYFHEVYNSDIVLLHIVPEGSFFRKILSPEELNKHNSRASKKLKKLVKKFFKDDIPDFVKMTIMNGELIPTILKTSEMLNSNLIIIKKAERIKGRYQFFKKENADKLIAEAICPVMTIKENPVDFGIKKILIPVDITKRTTNKIAWGISLAKKFNAEIHIVSVQNLDIKLVNSLSYKKSKEIEESFRKEGLEANMVILKSKERPMEEVVLDHASEINPDIILIMTHQETILFDNYLGNFASELIHKSVFPVFSVVPRKETVIEGFLRSPSYKH